MNARTFLVIAIVSSIFCGSSFAQTVAIVGRDSNSPDEFTFVALKTLANGTKIFFTEQDYDNTAGTFDGNTEGTLIFTASAEIAKGVVVHVSESSEDAFTVSGGGSGTATLIDAASNDWSVFSGDPIYAYDASNDTTPWNNVTEVYAMLLATDDALGTRDPSTGTSSHPNAVVVKDGTGFGAGSRPSADYTADRSTATLADLRNRASFTANDGDLDVTSFAGSPLPVTVSSFAIE